MASIWLSGTAFYFLGRGELREEGIGSEVGDLTAYASSCTAVPITTSLFSPNFTHRTHLPFPHFKSLSHPSEDATSGACLYFQEA